MTHAPVSVFSIDRVRIESKEKSIIRWAIYIICFFRLSFLFSSSFVRYRITINSVVISMSIYKFYLDFYWTHWMHVNTRVCWRVRHGYLSNFEWIRNEKASLVKKNLLKGRKIGSCCCLSSSSSSLVFSFFSRSFFSFFSFLLSIYCIIFL